MKCCFFIRGLWAGWCILASPVFADDAAIGREIYQDVCASCHGKDMVSSGVAFDLRKFPKDDPSRFQNSVLNGKGTAMPPWRGQLSQEDVKALWDYLKTSG
jgi:mono/diheme cytochrome c family protein